MSPSELKELQINQQSEQYERNTSRVRTALGVAFLGGAATTALLLGSGALEDERIAQPVPFSETAQEFVNNIDDALAVAGAAGLVGGLALIGGTKVGARYSSRIRNADKYSSQEASDDGKRNTAVRRLTRSTFAGNVPVIVLAASGLGTLTAAIGTEVTEGPDRPIMALEEYASGESMVAQDSLTNPMQNSTLTEGLVSRTVAEANKRGITATPVSLGLGNTLNGEQTLTSLLVGVPAPADSEIAWDRTMSCEDIPVYVDNAADISIGSSIDINGISSEVVGEVTDMSAMNRIGVMMDQDALNACQEKNEQNPSDFIVMDTDQQTAASILDIANTDKETSAALTKEQYLQNNRKFWEANVQPITNTMALLSLAFSGVAMAGAMGSRILRNRRELGAKLAGGYSANMLRYTEILRSTKDGVFGTFVGVTGAAAIAPVVNSLESGMRIGVGVKEAMVGASVGILGSVVGAATRIARPHKAINPSESTRV